MELNTLRELFCEKIALELERYKRKMLKRKPEVILERAYQIDSVINIYEILLEKSREFSEEALKNMLVFPNLLAHFYLEWMKQEDSYHEELQNCMKQSVEKLEEIYSDRSGKETDAA